MIASALLPNRLEEKQVVTTNQEAAEPIQYGIMQHESTGDVWAIKHRGGKLLGARRMNDRGPVYIDDLPSLIYDVGESREYVDRQRENLAIWPFAKQRQRPIEFDESTDN